MPRFLIIMGLVLLTAGILWPLLQKIGLGRLPGDIVIERKNFTLYIPLMTSVLVALVINTTIWIIGRFF
jgi:hypothetical protein